MKMKYKLALSAIMLFPPLAANAGLIQIYSATGASGIDAAFENTGGWLETTYGLPTITKPNGSNNTTVLPQVERAVAQLARNNANGLHLTTAVSGIPGVSYSITGGGTGSGVWDALTNHSPVGNGTNGGGTVTGSLTSFNGTTVAVPFSFSRTGTIMSYTADGKTWTSAAQSYYSEINALEFRLRSTSGNTETLTNLVYNGVVLSDISAANGFVTISLFSGVTGDFNLNGTFNTTGATTGWNHQIKGLDLPILTTVPEPSSLALLTIGIGIVGASLRRKPLCNQVTR